MSIGVVGVVQVSSMEGRKGDGVYSLAGFFLVVGERE